MFEKIVITSCDENEDYLQFWKLIKLSWLRLGWKIRFYFIGSEKKYLTLNQDEEKMLILFTLNLLKMFILLLQHNFSSNLVVF